MSVKAFIRVLAATMMLTLGWVSTPSFAKGGACSTMKKAQCRKAPGCHWMAGKCTVKTAAKKHGKAAKKAAEVKKPEPAPAAPAEEPAPADDMGGGEPAPSDGDM